MLRPGNSFSATHALPIRVLPINALLTGALLLACTGLASAQRHGAGGASSAGGSSLSSYGRPDGVDEKDPLKDFHASMALQATSPQVAEFQLLLKSTAAAQAKLQTLLQALHTQNLASDAAQHSAVAQALANARTENKNFQEGFSPEQKSGLKDIARRLAKTDADLDQEEKKLDQSLELKAASPEIVAQAESLEKALTEFHDQQLVLGREMSITLASGQDLVFTLPHIRTAANLGTRTLPVAVSGMLTQVAAQAGQRKFKLELSADLSELQQNIFEILSAQLDTSETCGQRVAIRQATLTPATPAGLLVVRLHFERWICTRSLGPQSANELAESDGTVEIKLTAALETPAAPPAATVASSGSESNPSAPIPAPHAAPNGLKIAATLGRVTATGMLEEELRSGSLGENLRDQAVQALLAASRAGSDLKSALPPAVQNSAVIQSARFQNFGVGGLSLVLEGQIEISNQQADQLATQLNQTLSAKAPASP